ncbi:MAG: hypothetical protein QM680_01295 [Luteolibacter sp.]
MIRFKNRLPAVSSGHHVINSPRILDSQRPRHPPQIQKENGILNAKMRGPTPFARPLSRPLSSFLSLSEFVNRQLSSDKDLALAGALQTALNQLASSSDIYGSLDAPLTDTTIKGADYQFKEAADGSTGYGLPGWTRQADILRPLAPILSARDDTFVIRTYGDARDASGKVLATAYCEAVVQRTRDYCDPVDKAELVDFPSSPINQTFGRKFEMVSFRWLSKSEI